MRTRNTSIYLLLLTLLLCLLPVQSWAAVAFGTIGSGAGGTTSLSVPLPASLADGDLMVMCVSNKYPTNGPSTPSGWTAPANNQGTGSDSAAGPDTGPTYATIFYKVAASESGNVAVTITSGNSSYGFIARYTNATGLWSAAAAQGGDLADGANWTATMGSDPGITAGDMVVACSARNEGIAISASAEAITATGLTIGTEAERGDNGTSFGDNIMAVVSDHAISSGTASDVVTYTFTSATTSGGGTVILRIRETAASSALQPSSGYLGGIIK